MSGKSGPFRIVLLEDNPADSYLFRKALELAEVNFELTVIEDGADGMAFARQDGSAMDGAVPDLAVLDLNLPKHEGLEVLRAMRNNAALREVAVVITSSSASKEERAKAQQLGVTGYLVKPLDLEGFRQMGLMLRDVLLALPRDVGD